MGFSRQEYWLGLPFSSPGDLPDPGIEPGSPALPMDSLPSEPPGDTEMNRMRALQTLTVWMIWDMDKNGKFSVTFFFILFSFISLLRIFGIPPKQFPFWNFPGGPVGKTLHFNCRGHKFNPWSGNWDPTCCMVAKTKKQKCWFIPISQSMGLHLK